MYYYIMLVIIEKLIIRDSSGLLWKSAELWVILLTVTANQDEITRMNITHCRLVNCHKFIGIEH